MRRITVYEWLYLLCVFYRDVIISMEIGGQKEIPHCVCVCLCATAALVKLKYHFWHKQKMIYGPSAIRLHCSSYTFYAMSVHIYSN